MNFVSWCDLSLDQQQVEIDHLKSVLGTDLFWSHCILEPMSGYFDCKFLGTFNNQETIFRSSFMTTRGKYFDHCWSKASDYVYKNYPRYNTFTNIDDMIKNINNPTTPEFEARYKLINSTTKQFIDSKQHMIDDFSVLIDTTYEGGIGIMFVINCQYITLDIINETIERWKHNPVNYNSGIGYNPDSEQLGIVLTDSRISFKDGWLHNDTAIDINKIRQYHSR